MWKAEITEQGVPTSLSTSRKTEDVSTFVMMLACLVTTVTTS